MEFLPRERRLTMDKELARKLLAEFIGTFFLVFTIAFSGNPIAIGVVLMVMVYATGSVSGGMLNPAVSLGVFLRGKLPGKELIPYMIAQVAASLAAGCLFVLYNNGMGTPKPVPELLPTMGVEFLFSFALVFMVLMVATSSRTEGNSYFGFAIGGTVLAGALTVGHISGGAFNPAVAMLLPLLGVCPWSFLWVYMGSIFAGGFVAAYAFKFLLPDE
jgi:aquaporin Z